MSKFNNNIPMVPITKLLEDIVDNRGKSCPTCEKGFPLIATNCIKHTSIYPTFENIRYVSDEVLHNWFRAELKPNDILFVNKGTPGRVCLVPDPVSFCAAQDMIGLRVDPEKIYYKYLFAVLRSEFIQKKIANFHVGIAIPHFKKSDLDNLLIPVPDKKIQVKIGDLFCQLSEKIELNNRINAELESIAKTLYDYWFLQFEFPNEEGKPYKSSGGKMVWNEELKREIPEGWEVVTLNNVTDTITKGTTPSTLGYNFTDCGVNFVKVESINNGQIVPELLAHISFEAHNKMERSALKKDDILLTIAGRLGTTCVVSKNILPANTNQAVGIIRLKNEHMNLVRLIYEIILSDEIQAKLLYANAQSIQKNLNLKNVGDISFALPLSDTLQLYNQIVEPVFEKIENNYIENQELAELRDFLLPLLMNGQVGFKE